VFWLSIKFKIVNCFFNIYHVEFFETYIIQFLSKESLMLKMELPGVIRIIVEYFYYTNNYGIHMILDIFTLYKITFKS